MKSALIISCRRRASAGGGSLVGRKSFFIFARWSATINLCPASKAFAAKMVELG
jgi:hypothetical protein